MKSRDKSGLQQPPPLLGKKALLSVSFLEGAAVMVIELMGAKIVAPFYGTSLYVWASVLGVTLMALAGGYYAGGRISQKYTDNRPLFLVLGVGAAFTILAPQIAPSIMMATSGLGVRMGSLVSVLLYLFVPITCMGMVSPLITQQINRGHEDAGLSAGTVYAVSTVGGILATYAAGFYLIPELGIRATAILTGGLLGLMAVVGMIWAKRMSAAVVTIAVCLLFIMTTSFKKGLDPKVKVQYQSSGILGEWTVVDQVAAVDQNGQSLYTRQLLLNGVDQTFTEVGNEPVSMWLYPHKLSALAGIKPEGSRALLLGMGGGSIAHGLIQLGFRLDIVELDQRVPKIAQKWFGFDPATAQVHIDDARHFIKNSTEKYDVVVLDLVNGEVQPSHVFTQEGLQELKQILQDDALVIVNFQGRFDMEKPELSIGPRSVYKTFEAIGYKMFVSKRDAEDEKNLSADLLMYGTPGKLQFDSSFQKELRYNAIFPFEKFTADNYQPVTGFKVDDAQVLTDDKPNLELLNAPTILDWRKNKMVFTMDGLLKKGLSIFH
ncbi:MAG TPA: fused MFS/spermidine synthase [Saprospiraceae bacterium]|nr:fused MFS/spermidine synthase [Saprospiraceae bacterium]